MLAVVCVCVPCCVCFKWPCSYCCLSSPDFILCSWFLCLVFCIVSWCVRCFLCSSCYHQVATAVVCVLVADAGAVVADDVVVADVVIGWCS